MGIVKTLRFVAEHPLNQGARLAALSRFARLQVAGRLIARPFALPFVNGTSLLVQQGMTGVTGNWYCGLHEPAEMGFILHALRPEDLFLDVGANAGSYTVLASGAVGARSIAIEPLPSTFARLTANVRLNDLEDRVTLRCCGLSAQAGELRFTTEHDTGNRVAIPGETRATTSVPVLTMDEVCGTAVPTIVKIDVEGHELPVLRGARATLGSPALLAVLMETNQSDRLYGEQGGSVMTEMTGHGFTPFGYDPFKRELLPWREGQENTVFVRRPEEVAARCRAAPRFTLINGTL